MKSFLLIIIMCCNIFCTGQTSLNDATLTLGHGSQHDGLNLAREIEKSYNSGTVRTMRFTVNFDSNCAYDFATDGDSGTEPGNQIDWNKLMHIETWPNSTKTSVRLGWRFNTEKGKMQLGLYAHIRHIGDELWEEGYAAFSCGGYNGREFFYLTDIDVETDIQVVMIMTSDEILVRANGNEGSIKRYLDMEACDGVGSVKTAFERSAFFGGQENPPHDMTIYVKDILVDYDYNSVPTNKTFARSVFYPDEVKSICAYNAVNLSYEAERGQNGTTFAPLPWSEQEVENVYDGGNGRYTIIQSGSDVTATAGAEVNLLPGFHALAGSSFVAKIGTPGCGNFYDARIANANNNIIPVYNQLQNNLAVAPNEELKATTNVSLPLKLSIYPNPNNGEFVLELNNAAKGNYSIQITDALGRNVMQQNIITPEQNLKQSINLQAYGKGIYVVKINGETVNEVRKIIYE